MHLICTWTLIFIPHPLWVELSFYTPTQRAPVIITDYLKESYRLIFTGTEIVHSSRYLINLWQRVHHFTSAVNMLWGNGARSKVQDTMVIGEW